MAIEYVEIRNANREIIGIVDAARSIIWHSVYYGVGDFEIYAQATPEHLTLLAEGNYVTRLDDTEIGIIEAVAITYDIDNGRVITATGRFAKSLLDRRIIYNLSGTTNKRIVLQGNVESAVRAQVVNNAISCTFDARRNMAELELGARSMIPDVIVDDEGEDAEKQANDNNLLEYTDSVLQEYSLSAMIVLNAETKKLQYIVYKGADRSIGNEEGNEPIIFSQELDNLTGSEYTHDTQNAKTAAFIGGEGEGAERFYCLLPGGATGINRRELFVDASGVSKAMSAEQLAELYPTGTFTDINFYVNGILYATLVYDLSKQYKYDELVEIFPRGQFDGKFFLIGNEKIARLMYNEADIFTLTPLGFLRVEQAEERAANYELNDDAYASTLRSQGKQQLAEYTNVENFTGTIDITNGQWQLNRDFELGDVVTVQDDQIGKRISTRIIETLETQDENGYTVEAVYG